MRHTFLAFPGALSPAVSLHRHPTAWPLGWRVVGASAVLVLAAASTSRAQAVSPFPRSVLAGRIIESTSRAPVAGALVRVLEASRADLSHADGEFAFRDVAAGTYRLRVTRIGFRPESLTVRVTADGAARLEIALQVVAVDLAPTIVTGSIRARDAADAVSPTTVVSGAALDRQLAATVAATLQNQPGMSITTLGPAAARPVIRGLSGDRVVMLEDGLRPGDLAATSSDHAVSIDPLNSRQLEVVRGPMSLLYGSSALGGVINVIRDEVPVTLPEHFGGTVGLTGTSVDRGAAAGGTVNGRAGNLAYRAEGTARTSSDQRTPLGVLSNTATETLGAALGAAYVGSRGHVGASYRFYDNSYGVPGGFVGGHASGVRIDMRRHSARVELESRPTGGLLESVRATAGATRYRHEEYESGGSLGTSYAQTVVQGDLLARHRPLGAVSEGALGLRYQYRDIVTGGTLRTPSTYDQSAAAFVVEQFGTRALRLLAGARFEWARYDPYEAGAVVIVNGIQVPARPREFANGSGTVGVLFDAERAFGTALRGVRVGANVGRAYRTPDFNELYSNGPHLAAFSYDVGSPSLRAETGLGVDVFARLTRSRVRGEIAAYRNRMSDFIFPRNTGDIGFQGNRPKFQFTGRDAVLSGAEGGMDITIRPEWTLDASLSYVRGAFLGAIDSLPADSANGILSARAGSRALPLMPPLHGHVGVQYEQGQRTARSFFGGVAVRGAATQQRTGDFETPTAGYALLELNAGARMLVRNRFHTLTLRVDNALDRAWRNHLSRTKDVRPEAGRNLSLLYRVTF